MSARCWKLPALVSDGDSVDGVVKLIVWTIQVPEVHAATAEVRGRDEKEWDDLSQAGTHGYLISVRGRRPSELSG